MGGTPWAIIYKPHGSPVGQNASTLPEQHTDKHTHIELLSILYRMRYVLCRLRSVYHLVPEASAEELNCRVHNRMRVCGCTLSHDVMSKATLFLHSALACVSPGHVSRHNNGCSAPFSTAASALPIGQTGCGWSSFQGYPTVYVSPEQGP